MRYDPVTRDTKEGMSVEECYKKLKAGGADVVGTNCFRGPDTMLPIVERIRKAVDGPIAAIPVPYKTCEEFPNWFLLPNKDPHYPCDKLGRAFPGSLENYICTRWDIAEFAKKAKAIGV